MQDSSNTERPRDITDLLALRAADFHNLDSRVTSANGRPGKGDRVVIINATTSEDFSISLNDFEVDALLMRLTTAFPDTRCNLHRPYQRGMRTWFDDAATCTCTKVFASRLLECRLTARTNALEQARTRHSAVTTDWSASEERWPGALQSSLFAQRRVS